MKKVIYFLLIILLLTSCGKTEEEVIEYDDTYYQVASPYKKGVSYSIKSYDKLQVESMLMNLSTNYFKVNNSLYQEGQYLSKDELKELINLYNETDIIKIDNKEIEPKYIISIYEQNYLSNNNLKGISLAIVLDNKQYYNNNLYKIVEDELVLNYGIEKANLLVKYLRDKGINETIVIGLYLNDGFKYIGSTNNDSIKFKYINYNYQYLDSNYVMNNDNYNYNNILAIKKALNYDSNLYISAKGLYKDKELTEVDITINKSYLSQSEILNIFNVLNDNLNTFGSDKSIKVYLKSNNNLRAFISKKANDIQVKTYILEG